MNRTAADRTRIDTTETKTGTALGRFESNSAIIMNAWEELDLRRSRKLGQLFMLYELGAKDYFDLQVEQFDFAYAA